MTAMLYNRLGTSGLKLPAISLGLWHNFGGDTPFELKRSLARKAYDLGITHFDLANNYGPPPGSAEESFGFILKHDFAKERDKLIISTKAGYHMWDGPYGEWGSRKYMLASLDQSLKRLGISYVDIFYSHRFDPDTPLEETMGALDTAVRSGRALYAGLSNYGADQTRAAARILKDLGTPCLIHQPRYNLLDRAPETGGTLKAIADTGMGSIAFSPLAQGLLTDKYLTEIPAGSRATQGKFLKPEAVTPALRKTLMALSAIAEKRNQSLAQLAIAWVLRPGGVTSALIGASKPEHVEQCASALAGPAFTAAELSAIDAALKA
jgi:L-glyceraldehyde 3-phosphate reductase